MPEGTIAKVEPDLDSYIETFFAIATQVSKENDFLADRLAACEADDFYGDYHQGIAFLFEMTLASLKVNVRDFFAPRLPVNLRDFAYVYHHLNELR